MNRFFDLNLKLENSAVAFGSFDGIHLGHREVLKRLADYPNSVVLSLTDESKPVLTTEAEKEFILDRLGINTLISVKASQIENMELPVLVETLIEKLGAKTIVCGSCYPKLEELRHLCKTNLLNLEVVDTVFAGEEILTDKLIKDGLACGDMNEAIQLLGGSYVLSGTVVHGRGKGKKHRMPTANLNLEQNKILPKYGVYGTFVNIGSGRYRGMTNVGPRPSADNDPKPTCETLIENFDGVLYDIRVVVEAFFYVRPVLKFQNLDDVRKQIEIDKMKAEEFLTRFL